MVTNHKLTVRSSSIGFAGELRFVSDRHIGALSVEHYYPIIAFTMAVAAGWSRERVGLDFNHGADAGTAPITAVWLFQIGRGGRDNGCLPG